MRRLLTALRRLAALEKSAEALPELGRRLAALEQSVEPVPELARRTTARASEIDAASARIERLEHALDEQRRHLQVRTVMDWIAHATVRTAPLVSIVLPTRDRCAWLPRAIASVRAQTYPHWELLIVDDGSVDDTPALLASLGEGPVRTFQAQGAGVCAARNVALAHARGGIIAYLDDDNLMHPGWLKSVVWGFEQRPETETLYGAFVVDDTARVLQVDRGDLPRLCFYAYDHKAVAENNIADIGCIAHRAGLAEAHFDESLREMGDWDLFLRLTRDRSPLALPAIACFYTTDAPHRLSNGPTNSADGTTVRAKNRR
jgi:Glycosyl transferase family 2